MVPEDRWLLPEGIEEILPPAAGRLERLRHRLLDLYQSWGYELVIPPLIEFLESLLTGTGNDLELQTFKLTDQLSGRMMGVRADMTPQVARIDAHLLKRDGAQARRTGAAVLYGDGAADARRRFRRFPQPLSGRSRAIWPSRPRKRSGSADFDAGNVKCGGNRQ